MFYFYHEDHGIGFVEEIGSKTTLVRFPKSKAPPRRFLTTHIKDKLLPVTPENFSDLRDREAAKPYPDNSLAQRAAGLRMQFTRLSRPTHCYRCKTPLDSAIYPQCDECNWIICPHDGACGCGFQRMG